jgi:hypothetical protein
VIHLLGRIANTSDQPIVVRNVAGSLLESNGELLAIAPASVHASYLDPGEDTPVRISFLAADAAQHDGMGYEVFYELEASESLDDLSLKFEEPVDYLDPAGKVHLVGEVQNGSNIPLMLNLIAAMYDAEGKMVDAAEIEFIYAPPGEAASYDFDHWGLLEGNSGPYLAAESFSLQWDPGETERLSTTPYNLEVEVLTQQATELGLKIIGVLEIPEIQAGSRIFLFGMIRERETRRLVAVEYFKLAEAQLNRGEFQIEVQLSLPTGFRVESGEISLQAILIPPQAP